MASIHQMPHHWCNNQKCPQTQQDIPWRVRTAPCRDLLCWIVILTTDVSDMGLLDEKCSSEFTPSSRLLLSLWACHRINWLRGWLGDHGLHLCPLRGDRGSFPEDIQSCIQQGGQQVAGSASPGPGKQNQKSHFCVEGVNGASPAAHGEPIQHGSRGLGEKGCVLLVLLTPLGASSLDLTSWEVKPGPQSLGLLSKGLVHSGVSHRSQPSALRGKHLKYLKQIHED